MRRDNRRRGLDWLNFCSLAHNLCIVRLAKHIGRGSIPYIVGVRNSNIETSPYFNLIMCAHVTFNDNEYSDSYYFHSFKTQNNEEFYDYH